MRVVRVMMVMCGMEECVLKDAVRGGGVLREPAGLGSMRLGGAVVYVITSCRASMMFRGAESGRRIERREESSCMAL